MVRMSIKYGRKHSSDTALGSRIGEKKGKRRALKNQEIGEILKAGVVTWSEDGFRT